MKTNIAIFASGSGSNAEVIMQYFKNHATVQISLVVTNNPNAGVLVRADKFHIPCYIYQAEELENGILLNTLQAYSIDFIVLAGYLKKVSDQILRAFPNKIVNIHPALLPKFGGKGMYGMNVHRAVVAAGEQKSGITIHYVNENYDEGAIIEQHEVILSDSDDAERVQQKVLALEHQHFAPCIEKIVNHEI